ncbi:hypothetical protein D3C76_1770130 [compost metagenome]
MGASLLAKAMYQTTSMLNDSPLSRAGSLPQRVTMFYSVTVGILRGAMKYIQISAMKYIAGIMVNSTV